MLIDTLNHNHYGNTLADGSYGEIEVSEQTLVNLQDALQEVIDAYTWKGPARQHPPASFKGSYSRSGSDLAERSQREGQ